MIVCLWLQPSLTDNGCTSIGRNRVVASARIERSEIFLFIILVLTFRRKRLSITNCNYKNTKLVFFIKYLLKLWELNSENGRQPNVSTFCFSAVISSPVFCFHRRYPTRCWTPSFVTFYSRLQGSQSLFSTVTVDDSFFSIWQSMTFFFSEYKICCTCSVILFN